MRTIGLTGGIATGKSTVARILRVSFDAAVIDADRVAREVVALGSPGLAQVVQAFGPEVLTPEGALDRSAMRARIVANPEARATLEGITHPRIRTAVAEKLAMLARVGQPVAVVEAALMVETGSYQLYDVLLVVSCAPETQLQRLMAREGLDEASARGWIATQLSLAEKERVADAVVYNDGDLDALQQAVSDIWPQLAG